jgi:hypothetical protein
MAPQEIFKPIALGERWSKKTLHLSKTLAFNKTGGAATSIDKTTISFFSGDSCSGNELGEGGAYTTPNGSNAFTISNNTPFGLTTTAAYQVASDEDKADISDMSSIGSMAIVLRSSDNDVPQGDFSGSTACSGNPSFCCVKVDCSVGSVCTERDGSIGTQDFTLKSSGNAAVGDPADGGVIADVNGLIATPSDNSTNIHWGGFGTFTNAQSDTDGAGNTSAIVTTLGSGTYAAQLCDDLEIAGGYTSDWFLPAKDQLNTLYTKRGDIGGFNLFSVYWSSTESTSSPDLGAWAQDFFNGAANSYSKSSTSYVRCVRAFTP